eukprot:TRINITY_DN17848_c0_g1_i1.p1 TRINITY_DN17848_c0_g1~~TRINITY_DN17848_c0_g1_i1.p1  ORF type:complete len:451 (-),score=52.13 TRINITY_DN17848_c0_g1_i1:333-1637(-)
MGATNSSCEGCESSTCGEFVNVARNAGLVETGSGAPATAVSQTATGVLKRLLPDCPAEVLEKLRSEGVHTADDLAALGREELRELGLSMPARARVLKWASDKQTESTDKFASEHHVLARRLNSRDAKPGVPLPNVSTAIEEISRCSPVSTPSSVSTTVPTCANGHLQITPRNAAICQRRKEQEVEDGAIYAGQWQGKHRHGYGALTMRSGKHYEGYFADSMFHGHGVMTGTDGNMYDGEWQMDRMHGFGKYVSADGTYDGHWANDEKCGKGVETMKNGAQYEGEYRLGKKHGFGKYSSGTGMTFEGQFVNDTSNGHGTYTFADGRKYVGNFTRGRMNGKGRMVWPNGSVYEGEYVSDVKSGQGMFRWPDGRTYIGQFAKGKPHGMGSIATEDGHQGALCEWNMGVPVQGSARSQSPGGTPCKELFPSTPGSGGS